LVTYSIGVQWRGDMLTSPDVEGNRI
jgi:hypothetical protein